VRKLTNDSFADTVVLKLLKDVATIADFRRPPQAVWALRIAAQRRFWAAAIRFRTAALTVRFGLGFAREASVEFRFDSHLGGLPRRLPPAAESRSMARIAS
jgi:hypothetical protein